MAHPNFRKTHDVQSFAKLYQEKERKQRERKRQKRQCQLEEQPKHQQTSTNLSTVLATQLEQDVGALILTETQASGKIGSVTAENTKPSLPDEIKSPVSWSTCTPELAQPPTEPNSQEVAIASSRSEQPLALDLVRRSTEQLTSCLSDMNAYIAGSKERSKTSDTGESCDNNGSAKDGYTSSYDNSTENDNSGDDSDSDSASIGSDHSAGLDIPEEKGKRPQRRRWTSLDELRLRAWVQEGKVWPWIARKLQRSEQAINQHWAIMGKQDTQTARM
ncbi:unnamed protein product [Colletotrichum noveboracense]|uniref:Myb-like domain-containing protein n=1 Tax=Colletotrichum noveboracense TaxID=2664923 RepID=A0A9W4S1A1_9PEZI|nr:unnamed protein product [Colletotrichum noveboracense]